MNISHPLLITMPQSHYAEKARWAMDRVFDEYVEEPHVPGLHRLATLLYGGGSVPVMVHGEVRCTSSREILSYCDWQLGGGGLYPSDAEADAAVRALEELFDCRLGPASRVWAYQQTMQDAVIMTKLLTLGTPLRERMFWRVGGSTMTRLIARGLAVSPENAVQALDIITVIFEEVGRLLSDGRMYLQADQFTAADLTFAALASPVLLPPGGPASYPVLDDTPERMRVVVEKLRSTIAGQHCMRMYAQER